MNILAGNLKADGGDILLNGKNITAMDRAYREILGFMPQQQSLYPGFTAVRFLDYMAALKGMTAKDAKKRIPEILDRVGLYENRNQKIRAFSGGMKQRLLIAQAILNEPGFIILDEPTAGLDPQQRIKIRNLIAEIAMDRIVLVATHVVQDIAFVAKEVIFLQQGAVLRKSSGEALIKEMEGRVYEVELRENQFAAVPDDWCVANLMKTNDVLLARIITDRVPRGWTYRNLKPSLEDAYLFFFGGDCADSND